MFFITSPWYKAHLPFLKSSIHIREQIESLIQKKASAKKEEKHTSDAAVARREVFAVLLEKTFKAYAEDIHYQVRSCPTR